MNKGSEIPEGSDDSISTEEMAKFLGAGTMGMLLTGFVHGKLHWHQWEVLIESTRAIGAHLSADQILQYLDSGAQTLENVPEPQKAQLFRSFRGFPPTVKRIIMGLCTRVAFADGHLDEIESDLIHDIADNIEIESQDRVIWKEEVLAAIQDAQKRGLTFTGIENLKIGQ